MSSPSLVLVLAEDQRQKQFIRRFLIRAGVGPHQMTIEISPSGHGSAEQWVRKSFVRQAAKCRARNSRASTGMFVLLDADALSVQTHLNELDEALTASNQSKVDATRDRIARLIPKWSIETWILYLASKGGASPVLSEEEPYKNSKTAEQWSELIPQAVATFFEWSRQGDAAPADLIDSLRLGIEETPRALAAGR